jgi:hypothetical protein
MKIHKLFTLVGVFAIFAGCGSPTGRVRVGRPESVTPARETVAVDTFDVGDVPEKPFREVAQLSCDAVPGEFLEVVRQFKIKARELGADAIILNDPVPYTGEDGYFARLMFRATAVAYKSGTASVPTETDEIPEVEVTL